MPCRSFFLAVSLFALLLALGCDASDPTVDGNGEVPPDTVTWRALGPDFLRVQRLRLFEPYLYASAREQGLWRLDLRDPGSRWQFLGLDHTVVGEPSSGASDVVVHPEHPDWLLAAYHNADRTDHSLYRSLNGGETWVPVDSALTFPANGETWFIRINALLAYPDRVLANAVHETRDFGNTWSYMVEHVAPGAAGHLKEQHPAETNMIWSGGVETNLAPSLGYTDDGGRNWISRKDELEGVVSVDNEVSSIGLTAQDVNTVYVGMLLHGQIAKSTDQGATWTLLEPEVEPVTEFDDSYTSILVDPSDRDRLWVVARGGAERSTYRLIVSEDGGANWAQVETPFAENVVLSDLLWDADDEVILMATSRGVHRFRPSR